MSQVLKELSKLTKCVDQLTIGQVVLNEINNTSNLGDLHFYMTVTPNEGYYQGASYRFKVEVPSAYPSKAPYVNCLNKIYHPNIDIDDGGVCVNLLDRDWGPEVGLDGCVMAVLFLFYHPNFLDALSTAFDGGPMDETEFQNNVRASLRGEAIDGILFDKLIDEGSKFIKEEDKLRRIEDCVHLETDTEQMKSITEHGSFNNMGSFPTSSFFFKNNKNTENLLMPNVNSVFMFKYDISVNCKVVDSSDVDIIANQYLNDSKTVIEKDNIGSKSFRHINNSGYITT